jgi:MoxR-like ATPase
MTTGPTDVRQISDLVRQHAEPLERVLTELRRVIVGQEALLQKMLAGLLADGHILLEGVPGLAKTTAINASLAQELSDQIPANPIHAGPASGGPAGNDDLRQPSDGNFKTRKGPDLRKPDPCR